MLYIFIWMISGVIMANTLAIADLMKGHHVSYPSYFGSLILSMIFGALWAPITFVGLKQGGCY